MMVATMLNTASLNMVCLSVATQATPPVLRHSNPSTVLPSSAILLTFTAEVQSSELAHGLRIVYGSIGEKWIVNEIKILEHLRQLRQISSKTLLSTVTTK